MSPAPEPSRRSHRPSPVTGPSQHADVIDMRPRLANQSPATPGPATPGRAAPGRSVDLSAETVVLGRSVTHPSRRERYFSAPPPARVQHRSRMLSSIVIAGGGVLAVQIAGEFGDVPLVATVALLATVLCGAILVAAQLTEEVRRARHRGRVRGRPSVAGSGP